MTPSLLLFTLVLLMSSLVICLPVHYQEAETTNGMSRQAAFVRMKRSTNAGDINCRSQGNGSEEGCRHHCRSKYLSAGIRGGFCVGYGPWSSCVCTVQENIWDDES